MSYGYHNSVYRVPDKPMGYAELDRQLQGRNKESRKLAFATYLQRRGENIALRLHDTDIVTFTPSGDRILNSGGWHTSFTKARIALAGIRLSQESGVWYVGAARFQDGITLKADGSITGAARDDRKADRQLKAKVKAYAKMYADALPLDKPSGGDCWFCYMRTQSGKTLGDEVKADHILGHIEEGYIVPSLAYNALKESDAGNMVMSLVFNNPEKVALDTARRYVESSIRRYVLKRLGYFV